MGMNISITPRKEVAEPLFAVTSGIIYYRRCDDVFALARLDVKPARVDTCPQGFRAWVDERKHMRAIYKGDTIEIVV